jgi:hypothetical protein
LGARASSIALALVCTGGMAFAEPARPTESGVQENSPPPFVRPSIRAVRIASTEAPVIDANLSDPAWEKAAVIDGFTQRSPNPYEPATERTVVRILYDEHNLYFSFYNYDSR